MGRTREGRGICSGGRPQTRADVGLCNCVRPLDQSVRASAIRHDAVEPLATEVAIGYDLVFAVLRCAARGRVVRRRRCSAFSHDSPNSFSEVTVDVCDQMRRRIRKNADLATNPHLGHNRVRDRLTTTKVET